MTGSLSPTGEPARAAGHRAAAAALAAICALFVARGLAYADFIPIWDGRLYADCAIDASTRGFTLSGLNCFNHPSAAYIGALALAERAAPGSFVPLLLANLALGVLALVFFYATARLLFPAPERRRECLLATAAFSLHPVVLASALNVNADYGVLVFLLPTLYCALRGRIFLTAVCGLALAFSKEPGIIYLAFLGAAYLAVELATRRPLAERWRAIYPLAWLFVPPLLLALYLLTKPRDASAASGLWNGLTASGLLELLLPVRINWPVFTNYLIVIFVLGFQWLPTLGAAVGVGAALRRPRALRDRLTASPEARGLAIVAIVFGGSLYVLTRFSTFVNVRYFLPLAPLLLLLAFAGVGRLERATLRSALWLTLCALFALASYTTFDPLSARLFGSFRFGDREMLAMTSRTHECCGFGRDQLVYNLQFTHFHTLQNMFYEDLRPTSSTVLTGPRFSNFWFFGPLDPTSFHRTLARRPDNVEPRFMTNADLALAPELPEKTYLLALPNLPFGNPLFGKLYDVTGTRTYEEHGYRLSVIELTLKPDWRALRPAPPRVLPAE